MIFVGIRSKGSLIKIPYCIATNTKTHIHNEKKYLNLLWFSTYHYEFSNLEWGVLRHLLIHLACVSGNNFGLLRRRSFFFLACAWGPYYYETYVNNQINKQTNKGRILLSRHSFHPVLLTNTHTPTHTFKNHACILGATKGIQREMQRERERRGPISAAWLPRNTRTDPAMRTECKKKHRTSDLCRSDEEMQCGCLCLKYLPRNDDSV